MIEYYPEVKDQLAKIARQTYEKQRRERLNQTADNETRNNAEDSTLEKNDPRRWLVADKETLKRRLSLIEAKTEVRSLANKFRKENGHSVNPREIIASIAQRARLERGDEDSRQIIKEFLAQGSGKKMPKRNTVSHDSFMANRKHSEEIPHENCFKDTSSGENCTIDQLRKSQRKFFSRPRSRTQESKPASPTRNDFPLFTFKETTYNANDDKGKESQQNEQESCPPAFTLNSGSGKLINAPIIKKGILKRSSAEIPLQWRDSSAETSFCSLEDMKSDEENSSATDSRKEGSEKIPKQKNKFKAPFSKDQQKDDNKILLATPENSEIVEDSPKLHRAGSRMKTTETEPFAKIEINVDSDCVVPEKRCACQQQEEEKSKQMNESCSASGCSSAVQEVVSSAGSFSPMSLVIEPNQEEVMIME